MLRQTDADSESQRDDGHLKLPTLDPEEATQTMNQHSRKQQELQIQDTLAQTAILDAASRQSAGCRQPLHHILASHAESSAPQSGGAAGGTQKLQATCSACPESCPSCPSACTASGCCRCSDGGAGGTCLRAEIGQKKPNLRPRDHTSPAGEAKAPHEQSSISTLGPTSILQSTAGCQDSQGPELGCSQHGLHVSNGTSRVTASRAGTFIVNAGVANETACSHAEPTNATTCTPSTGSNSSSGSEAGGAERSAARRARSRSRMVFGEA